VGTTINSPVARACSDQAATSQRTPKKMARTALDAGLYSRLLRIAAKMRGLRRPCMTARTHNGFRQAHTQSGYSPNEMKRRGREVRSGHFWR